MRKVVKVLIAFGGAVVGGIAGWIIGTQNSERFHKNKSAEEKETMKNINNQIDQLNEIIENDKTFKDEQVSNLKKKIIELKNNFRRHKEKFNIIEGNYKNL